MGKILILFLLTIHSSFSFAQVTLTIEGTVVNDTTTGTSFGVNIPRGQQTTFTYRNNSITSVNAGGYMLQAGDEGPASSNNNLKGEIITGNRFTWNGTDPTSITHALFTGYNINAVIKYNYLNKTPFSILRKSNGMTNTSGGVAYNIVIDPKIAFVAKGINNVHIYNNTVYSTKTVLQAGRSLVEVYTNTDNGVNAPSTGTRVYNNIFYTKHQIININIYEETCLSGFESDYNIFWCEAGEPLFKIAGVTKTFTQWQALGYDTHSVVMNPDFINFTDLVPGARLDYGTNLGTEWKTGLSTTATWVAGTSPATADQNGTWQVGARIYAGSTGYNANPNEIKHDKITIYPCPAHYYLNLSIDDPNLAPQIIKIIDLSGKIAHKVYLEQGIKNIQIPLNNLSGNYIVSLESDNIILYTQKLIII